MAGKAYGTLVEIRNLGFWAIGFVEQVSSKHTGYGLADCSPRGESAYQTYNTSLTFKAFWGVGF